MATYGGAPDKEDIKEEDVTNALKQVRYVFGLLEPDHFKLFKDLHMQVPLTCYKRSELEFVDMGTCLLNEEKNEKYYFIKMIHNNG